MVDIEYRKLENCDKCNSDNIMSDKFSEIHGHWYICRDCDYKCWGGRLKNQEKNIKRPKYPSPSELKIEYCQFCLLPRESLGYAETLETHHIDGNPQNVERLNLIVLCSSCHKLVDHQRTYRYTHFIRISKNNGA